MSTLTEDTLDAAMEVFLGVEIPFGIAMSPEYRTRLQASSRNNSQRFPASDGSFAGIPVIIDARLRDKPEVFHCEKKWLERVDEQRRFDAR